MLHEDNCCTTHDCFPALQVHKMLHCAGQRPVAPVMWMEPASNLVSGKYIPSATVSFTSTTLQDLVVRAPPQPTAVLSFNWQDCTFSARQSCRLTAPPPRWAVLAVKLLPCSSTETRPTAWTAPPSCAHQHRNVSLCFWPWINYGQLTTTVCW